MAVPSNPIAVGWLNENSLREYPFHEGCGLAPLDFAGNPCTGWTIPNCLLVDMTVAVDGSDYDPFLYLGAMSVVSRTVTLVFRDRSGADALSVFASADSHERYASYQASGSGSFLGARAVVCLGDLEEFFGLTPEGAYSFAPSETAIEPTCVRPSLPSVRSIRAVDASGLTDVRLTGDVSIVAGRNIRLDYERAGNTLVVSADPDSGYSEDCDCSSGGRPRSVRTINGIDADSVTIEGDGECVDVETDRVSGIIRIKDSCSKPCCGCAEAAFINQTINDLQTSVNTLSSNVSVLGERLTSFVTGYLLSRRGGA